jgi:hypothetical protein
MNMSSGKWTRCSKTGKCFDEYTIKELRQVVAQEESVSDCMPRKVVLREPEDKVKLESHLPDQEWMDQQCNILEPVEFAPKGGSPPSAKDLLGLSWKSDPEEYKDRRWVKVDSVMDSGASAPVAPPQMMPSIPIEQSEGSRRGQCYASASKHKLMNLGQQKIKACTEAGEETEVLFQIADVSKPLVSVSAICERGNRVIFGQNGGFVQNLRTGGLIPFERRNGIYVLSLWMEEGSDAGFTRR